MSQCDPGRRAAQAASAYFGRLTSGGRKRKITAFALTNE
jgi:hypothetical protein